MEMSELSPDMLTSADYNASEDNSDKKNTEAHLRAEHNGMGSVLYSVHPVKHHIEFQIFWVSNSRSSKLHTATSQAAGQYMI